MMTSNLSLAAVLIAIAHNAAAQPPGAPPMQARLDAIFAPLSRGAAPGCAAGIIREGRWLARGGYGLANIEQGVRITPDTLFYAASVSKQFTAAATIRLADLGKASLDDDVRKYIPELPEYSPPITVRHLLYQTSGLPDYFRLATEARRDLVEDPASPEEILAMIAKGKPIHPAGELYRYSNSNYFLLGEIIRRASGKSLRDFAREALFEPLGMKDTQYYDDANLVVPRRAVGYVAEAARIYGAVKTRYSLVGAGGLLTTINDLGKWTRIFDDPNAVPASPNLGARLMERGITTDGKVTDYAAGLSRDRIQEVEVAHHNGFFAGYVSTFTWVPERRMGLFALCNWSGAPDTLLQGEMLREGLRSAWPFAQTADRPEVRVGDEWKFAVYYTVPSETPNRTWSITSVTDAGIEGTENGEPLRLTRELNVVESPRDKSSNFKLLAFPLEVGKRWRYVNDWIFKMNGSAGRSTVEATVVGFEKVTVPAGEFDAFKLTSTEKLSGTSPGGARYAGEITRTYWYAPRARTIVKSVSHDPYLGTTTVQLVAFQLRP